MNDQGKISENLDKKSVKFKIHAPNPNTIAIPINGAKKHTFDSLNVTEENNNNNKNSSQSLYNLCDARFCVRKRNRSELTRLNEKVLQSISSKTTLIATERDDKDRKDDKINFNRQDNSIVTALESPRDSGPRVEIVNGKIVLKESSLVVGASEQIVAEGEYEEVEEGIHLNSRYSSFSKRKYSFRWTNEETKRFYDSLRQCGTEFSLMNSFFPNRTRRELKNKFFREERQHPELVQRALDASVPLDLSMFESKDQKKESEEEEDPEELE